MDSTASRGKHSDLVLEPLVFPTKEAIKADISKLSPSSEPLKCLLCQEEFVLCTNQKLFFKHLLEKHKLVIADINCIANLDSYLNYWRDKLDEDNLATYCSVIKTNTGARDRGASQEFYLLSDALPEDKNLRESLQKDRLDYILLCQQIEREDTSFSRLCLFCNSNFSGNRSTLIDHLAHDHHLNIGRADNIVFINHFLDVIEQKLNNFQCLFCEKLFKDRNVLKEHMRKKMHKKLNPKNSEYDKFYVINYLELGKNWKSVQTEVKQEKENVDSIGFNAEEEQENWDDWTSDDENGAYCLFCSVSSSDSEKLMSHIKDAHGFDVKAIRDKLNLDFYLQVKLVNYIRRQVHQKKCIACDGAFEDQASLMDHMVATKHTVQIPDKSVWDQPQYFFPTYENDNLLCALEEVNDNCPSQDQAIPRVPVVPEATIDPHDSILDNESVRKDLV